MKARKLASIPLLPIARKHPRTPRHWSKRQLGVDHRAGSLGARSCCGSLSSRRHRLDQLEHPGHAQVPKLGFALVTAPETLAAMS
jgi:hypothetical protein